MGILYSKLMYMITTEMTITLRKWLSQTIYFSFYFFIYFPFVFSSALFSFKVQLKLYQFIALDELTLHSTDLTKSPEPRGRRAKLTSLFCQEIKDFPVAPPASHHTWRITTPSWCQIVG